jgi:hypothetical protein
MVNVTMHMATKLHQVVLIVAMVINLSEQFATVTNLIQQWLMLKYGNG